MTHGKNGRFGCGLILTYFLLAAGAPTVGVADDDATAPAAGGAAVAEPSPAGETPDDYGITDTNFLFISGEDFQSSLGFDCQYSEWSDGYWICAGTSFGEIFAPIRLPPGSLVTGIRMIFFDGNASDDLLVWIHRIWKEVILNLHGEAILLDWSSTGTPGHTSTYVDVSDFTIQHHTSVPLVSSTYQSYRVKVSLDNSLMWFRGVVVYWKRQISAAPALPTFPDVAPGYWAFQEIEALAASGITTGFPDGTFRPTAPVTRAQMATFLARALGLHWK